MKHYLFVNQKGKKFKTTPTGKDAVLKNPKLSKICVLLGECNETGILIGNIPEPLTAATTKTLKEIMTAPVEEGLEVTKEVKFEEKPTTLKRKYNVKEKK